MVEEREEHPGHQVRRDRSQNRLTVDHPPGHEVPDDRNRRNQVQQAADPGDKPAVLQLIMDEEVRDRRQGHRSQRDVGEPPDRPARPGRPERHPHRGDLHGQHQGRLPGRRQCCRQGVRDDNEKEHQAVAVRRRERRYDSPVTASSAPAPAAVRRRGLASQAPQRSQPLAEPTRIRRQRPWHPDPSRFSHSYLLLSLTTTLAISAAEALRQGGPRPLRQSAARQRAGTVGTVNYDADDSCLA